MTFLWSILNFIYFYCTIECTWFIYWHLLMYRSLHIYIFYASYLNKKDKQTYGKYLYTVCSRSQVNSVSCSWIIKNRVLIENNFSHACMHLKPVLLIAVTCVLNEIQSVCKFSSMYTHSLIYVSSRFCIHLRCAFLHSFCSGNVIEATSTGISISSLQEAGKKLSVSYWSWRVSDR